MREIAIQAGIETSGMTDEQIHEALRDYKITASEEPAQFDVEKITERAERLGIDTTGMTGEEIVDAIKNYKASLWGTDNEE
jgi:post-segregation antitoxin (ccd killing protein)